MDHRRINRYVKMQLYDTIAGLYRDEKHGVIRGFELCMTLKNIAGILNEFANQQPITEQDQNLIYFLKSFFIDIQIIIDDVVDLEISHKDLVVFLKDIRYVCKDFIKETICCDDMCVEYVIGQKCFCAEHDEK